MASLRQLLDVASTDSISLGSLPSWLEKNQQAMFFQNTCADDYETGYNQSCFCCFEINSSMTAVEFEVWGGGGGGAGACCCAWGPPGGSGAYAVKRLDNTEGTYTGECYTLCVAPATCCSPNSCCGYQGCASFVLGSGLSNFCAEGGRPGCSFCNFFICFPNSGCGIVMHPCYDTDCSCYFGADSGVAGRHGGIEANCCNATNFCHYKALLPVPAGFGRTEVGYNIVRVYDNLGTNVQSRCHSGSWVLSGMPAAGTNPNIPIGQGGMSATVCGGNCRCGAPGSSGLIKISWS